jgi:uncharacterized protein YfaQ (DUF2300 family)
MMTLVSSGGASIARSLLVRSCGVHASAAVLGAGRRAWTSLLVARSWLPSILKSRAYDFVRLNNSDHRRS